MKLGVYYGRPPMSLFICGESYGMYVREIWGLYWFFGEIWWTVFCRVLWLSFRWEMNPLAAVDCSR